MPNKNYVVYKLINTDRNKEFLKGVPHIKFLDLSVIFHCLTEKECVCTASNLIYSKDLKQWDISLDKLYETASENTQKILGYEIKNMRSVMYEMIRKNPGKFDYRGCTARSENSVPMYVLSNKSGIEGAACMIYPKLIENFAEALGNSLYIIPSSINELLLLPLLNNVGTDIKNLVKETNDSYLDPKDILSYSLYYFDRKTHQISIF